MAGDNGPLQPQDVDQSGEVAADVVKGVARVRLIAEAVAALVDGDGPEACPERSRRARPEVGRREVPDAAVGGEAVQEQQRAAFSAPVPAVQAEPAATGTPAGQGDEPGTRLYDFFSSCTM